MNPRIAVIILNWNGWEDTIECLESLYQINYPNFNVVVVDNNSQDESIKKIKDYCDGRIEFKSDFLEYNKNNKPVQLTEYTKEELEFIDIERERSTRSSANRELILIKNCENYGFAGGNNIGAGYALKVLNPDYILLLNNDTVVNKNFLDELVKVAESDESIGSVQSLLLKPGGKIIDSLGHETLIWAGIDKGADLEFKNDLNEDIEIFGSCAAAALYRSSLIKKIELFDKDFFTIYEDFDLSWRIRLEGFKSILAVKSIVYHKRGVSKTLSEIKRRDLLNQHSQGYNLSKNLLIIAIRYNPLSSLLNLKYWYKLIITSGGLFYFSLRVRKTQHTIKILKKNIGLRKDIQKNPLLKELHKKWIIKKII